MIEKKRGKMQEIFNNLFISKNKNIIKFNYVDEKNNILEHKMVELNDFVIGNIFLGIIEFINYSLEIMFVNIGQNQVGFLSFKNVHAGYFENDAIKLKKNDKILVEIIKEAVSRKQLNLTTYIALSGEFCIYLPYFENQNGLSSNIKGEIRFVLKNFVTTLNVAGSLILRTNAINASLEQIEKDYNELRQLFAKILKMFQENETAMLLNDNDIVLKTIRSYLSLVKNIYCDNLIFCKHLQKYYKKNIINLNVDFVKEFPETFHENLQNIYSNVVALPSGGEVVFQKTEACVVIDINSKTIKKNIKKEELVFMINKEAAELIARHILLKNICGIIIIDFIDMTCETYIEEINQIIKKGLKKDKCSNKILKYNELGLVQISREKIGINILDKIENVCFCKKKDNKNKWK